MVVYLDTSAIVKLVVREPESAALTAELEAFPERVASVVADVEVARAVRRASISARVTERMRRVVSRLGLIELSPSVRQRAASLGPISLRSLDAIHIATALDLGDDLDAFITYDERQAAAARDAELEVSSPA